VVVVRRAPAGWLFLLLRAYRNWDFPKGVVAAGEPPLAAARREVKEETLIEDLQLRWGEEFYETEPYSNNKIARYYIAETQTERVTLPISPELGRPEHNESRWWDLSGALSVSSPRVTLVVNWAATKIGLASGNK
jgi:8-oxo-dGTP pyrophosphatase MutT (NUDIX family)